MYRYSNHVTGTAADRELCVFVLLKVRTQNYIWFLGYVICINERTMSNPFDHKNGKPVKMSML